MPDACPASLAAPGVPAVSSPVAPRRGDGDALGAGVAVVCALPAVVTLARSTW
jgi:hypothetical protein